MNRRKFTMALAGAAQVSFAAQAQQSVVPRKVGVLTGYAESDPEGQARATAFRQALAKLGWVEGRQCPNRFPLASG